MSNQNDGITKVAAGLDAVVSPRHIDQTTGWLSYPGDPMDVIAGNPACKLNMLRTKGEATPVHKAMLLTLEPSRFRYRFIGDESWIVLNGHAVITLESGERVDMKTGDLISIKGGRDSEWDVLEPFAKFVVVTSA